MSSNQGRPQGPQDGSSQGPQHYYPQPPQKKKSWPRRHPILLTFLVLCVLGLGSCTALVAVVASDPQVQNAIEEVQASAEAQAEDNTNDNAKETEAEEVEDEGPKLTLAEENAVGKAQSYLDSGMGFSKKGLVEQLKYEGFDAADAKTAVDTLGSARLWNEQAAAKAQSYMDSQSFSASGLAEQLKYEGFTAKQVAYGVKSVGY
ncbi:Ltp family lipoprotein [Kineosporia succinea]|uniref:Putative host cell surface-exposed lipoprotein Ltp-like HTH region domain-containing protein n=1 Tax=Kineosporia succinea TaxID=84632 RepID=A0ABT9P5Y3_9ACTN|nr:Ltp family lipoprotein [Kineosporia succinea]MDP9828087.1 hypothetical protein [Kineosporia succinea]